MLDNKTKERIAADAKKAARTAWEKLPVAAPMICIDPIQKEIQAVLEAEATRAVGLYDCLLKIRHNHYTENAVDKKIDEALTNYNNPK